MTYGYGAVYQRKDGRWTATVEMPRERGANRRRKVFSAKTREAVQAKLDAYREANPAKEHLGKEVYRERAREKGRHTMGQWYAKVRAVGCVCEYCGKKIRGLEEPSKDHRIPISRGGSDGIDNIAVSCWDCNREKGAMTADEFLAWRAARVA